MQLQGLLFMLFFLLVIPILAFSTNHLVFFAVMAIIITIGSIQSIYSSFLTVQSDEEDFDEEASEDIEDILDLNVKKFGTGMVVVKHLFLVLFFTYCSFYLNSILLKIDAVLLILIRVYNIKNAVKETSGGKREAGALDRNLSMVSGVLSLVLIIFTSFNIIFGLNF